jgi:hypothetical protein
MKDLEGSIWHHWRRGWDSNPRSRLLRIAVFETAAFNHSATSPFYIPIVTSLFSICFIQFDPPSKFLFSTVVFF